MGIPRQGRETVQVDALIERAKRLPAHLDLRAAILFDLGQLREAWLWMHDTPGVPAAAYGLLGLTQAHLHARLIRCEERAGERVGGAR
jgi:hypothetical protein